MADIPLEKDLGSCRRKNVIPVDSVLYQSIHRAGIIT
jgi:hypothetical protein